MTDRFRFPTDAFRRLPVGSSPSLLVVARGTDLRQFLRASLQLGYQVAEAVGGNEAAQHLAHCPPQGLIVGHMTSDGTEALGAALHGNDRPPVLKLWATTPPPRWADRALRHPFRRSDLLRAVARLMHESAWKEGRRVPDSTEGLRFRANGRA